MNKMMMLWGVMACVLNGFAGEGTANYPQNAVNKMLEAECEKRGIVIVDYHVHIRGGMTPEKALAREKAWIVRSSAMDNHGREWATKTDAQLEAFVARAQGVSKSLPVGIQVNDRDWFRQIAPETRAKYDFILADTMIMGKGADGRDNRLWHPQKIADAEKWMARYMAHNLQILGEPISILANPTYLPEALAGDYDRLWTHERMRALIEKAVARGIAIEIQAESPYPRPKFLALAKKMGAKFSFGTNNFDDRPKDLSRWLEVITWLDLQAKDIWSPACLRQADAP
jgi:hypothetical protein